MRTMLLRSLVVVLLLVALSLGHVTATHEPPLNAERYGPADSPHTDGTYVVWMASTYNLYAARLDDRQPFLVKLGTGGDIDIADGIVVFTQGSGRCRFCTNIHAIELATGEETVIADTEATEIAPAISQSWVVWQTVGAEGHGYKLWARDLGTMAEPLRLAENACKMGGPHIDGDRVVWAEQAQPSANSCDGWRLMTRRIGDEPVVLDELDGSGTYDITDDIVVYIQDTGRVVAFDLRTGARQYLTETHRDLPMSLATDGRYVFWTHTNAQREETIWGYDLTADRRFTVTEVGENHALDADDGVLVWGRFDQVFATTVQHSAPKTPTSAISHVSGRGLIP